VRSIPLGSERRTFRLHRGPTSKETELEYLLILLDYGIVAFVYTTCSHLRGEANTQS
jgi:hypothetical protein